MVSTRIVRTALGVIASVAVLYPAAVWFQNSRPDIRSMSLNDLFPVFGLIAFSLMWLHIVGGAMRTFLEKYINFGNFVSKTSIAVLILILLHPLLFLIDLAPAQIVSVFTSGQPVYLWLALIALIIFVSYDIAKLFKTGKFLSAHWHAVKFISTLAFFLIFFHSLGLGTDLQSGPLRYVWMFYGITAALATLYTYVLKTPEEKRKPYP
ncbi:MAG: hypothetical protein PHG63_03790 [Candidatus Dojkabacteria bacterium]|nr:hypothetical protein [Candidatus Dojkabacteria bacterium]